MKSWCLGKKASNPFSSRFVWLFCKQTGVNAALSDLSVLSQLMHLFWNPSYSALNPTPFTPSLSPPLCCSSTCFWVMRLSSSSSGPRAAAAQCGFNFCSSLPLWDHLKKNLLLALTARSSPQSFGLDAIWLRDCPPPRSNILNQHLHCTTWLLGAQSRSTFTDGYLIT